MKKLKGIWFEEFRPTTEQIRMVEAAKTGEKIIQWQLRRHDMSKEGWTASKMGKKGGSSKSEKKQAASRRNGLKGGGRPKKEKKEGE